MEKETLLVVGLLLLVLISAAQGIQINNIQGKIETTGAVTNTASQPSQAQQSLPSGLQNLPQQIGGC